MDGDSLPDVVGVTLLGSDSMLLYVNKGRDAFGRLSFRPVIATRQTFYQPFFANPKIVDLDGDAFPEIVFGAAWCVCPRCLCCTCCCFCRCR